MKLENFSEASNLVSELGTVEHQIRGVEGTQEQPMNSVQTQRQENSYLGITLGGTYQRAALLDEVRPVVLAYLNKHRAGILVKLAALGIRQK